MRIGVIIVAGGAGKRFILSSGGKSRLPKQFLPLNKRPVLEWAVRAFEISGMAGEMVVVLPRGQAAGAAKTAYLRKFGKVKKIVPGGATRFASVKSGLRELSGGCDIVLIHDGVRPLVEGGLIGRVAAAASKYGAAIAAVPVKDTVKEVSARNNVIKTVPRKGLWAAQTPQGFQRAIAEKIYKGRGSGGITDDAQLAEKYGYRVKVVPGAAYNLKVTVPEDIRICEAIIRCRNKSCGKNGG